MNYYNYFTEIEEHFRQARDSGMFMMSPLDWVLVEAWKDAGIPLAAVLKGIDRAFEKYHSRSKRTSTVNSIAYCTQQVLSAARETAHAGAVVAQSVPDGFDPDQLADFLGGRAEELDSAARRAGTGSPVLAEAARTLSDLADRAAKGELTDLEALEQRLTVLQDRVLAVATSSLTDEQMIALRRELQDQLRPYRRKLGAAQIAMLEQRFLRRKSLDHLGLSPLSLFCVS